MKRKFIKSISITLLMAGVFSIIPRISIVNDEKNTVYAAESPNIDEEANINIDEEAIVTAMIPTLKTVIEKIPVVGSAASVGFSMLSKEFFGITGEETNDKLDELQEKLDETFNKVMECYNILKLEKETGNFNTRMTSLKTSVSNLLGKISLIRKAEEKLGYVNDLRYDNDLKGDLKEYKAEFVDAMENYITGGDKFGDQLKTIRDYLLGNVIGQNKDVLTAYYNYNISISEKKLYIDAIRTSKEYQDNMLKIYSSATYCYLMYLYEKAFSTNNTLVKEECKQEIDSIVDDYVAVHNKYDQINSIQEKEKFYFNRGKSTAEIKSIKSINFCGENDSNKEIPADALDFYTTDEIMKNFDGSTTVRKFLKNIGFDIPDSARYLLASYPKVSSTGIAPSVSSEFYVKGYCLDSNDKDSQKVNFFTRTVESKWYSFIWPTLKDTSYDINCVYFSLR